MYTFFFSRIPKGLSREEEAASSRPSPASENYHCNANRFADHDGDDLPRYDYGGRRSCRGQYYTGSYQEPYDPAGDNVGDHNHGDTEYDTQHYDDHNHSTS